MNEKLTLFFRNTNPELSNLYIAPFEIDGVTYYSVEHYFMFQKAKRFDPDGDAIKKMGNDCTPAKMKKLGKEVENFNSDVWDKEGRVHMFHALTAKFTQNTELQRILLFTNYNLIGEASPFDRRWGIGLGVSNKNVYDPTQWKGTNWMGALMMAVRGSLRQDIDCVGDYCWHDGDTLYYHSEAGRNIEDVLYIYKDGKVKPNWPVLIDRFYNQSIDGYKDMADFERHFVCSTLIHTGVLDYAYSHSIDDFENMEESE